MATDTGVGSTAAVSQLVCGLLEASRAGPNASNPIMMQVMAGVGAVDTVPGRPGQTQWKTFPRSNSKNGLAASATSCGLFKSGSGYGVRGSESVLDDAEVLKAMEN